jgi:hypothetical protein
MTWRDEYRRCDRCKSEYRPARQAQSYCSPRCKRDAAYGRERFEKRTKRARRMRLEASETLPASRIARTVRNGTYSSIETAPCKPTKSLISLPIDLLGRGHRWPGAIRLDRELRERILWCEIGE